MRTKKDLPLAILKALKPFVNLKGDKFEVIAPEDALLHVVDKEPDSNFQFVIEKYQYDSSNSRFACLITKCPKSSNDNGIQKNWINITSLTDEFNGWLKLLEEYDTTPSFFDDPILKAFQEEYYSEFEIIDDEAETKPLNTKQILFLRDYLEELDKK
ncbi:hypothetical protein [Sphingobacterium paucimobilis]|uniref:Uncharacterized protein n=1 Tax=Sphingobacterium paucimobilis HER1398 TaxID=1346330 RepID=U2HY14_9SPHI|nr:hypothetical protein [Sphingobacterium paucimobilis]ERJ60452.1 hypothetical protein M472_16995 [Sphingobacterium paucimobilis HER1398]